MSRTTSKPRKTPLVRALLKMQDGMQRAQDRQRQANAFELDAWAAKHGGKPAAVRGKKPRALKARVMWAHREEITDKGFFVVVPPTMRDLKVLVIPLDDIDGLVERAASAMEELSGPSGTDWNAYAQKALRALGIPIPNKKRP